MKRWEGPAANVSKGGLTFRFAARGRSGRTYHHYARFSLSAGTPCLAALLLAVAKPSRRPAERVAQHADRATAGPRPVWPGPRHCSRPDLKGLKGRGVG